MYKSKILILLLISVGIFVTISISTWFYMTSQTPRYAQFWWQQQKQNGEITYLALGDSSAQGIGTSKPENSYVYQLAKQISDDEKKTLRIINLSKSGATTQKVIDEQLKSARNLAPDIVTLSVGTNDIYGGIPEEKILENFEIIAKSLPQKSLIAEIPYLMWSGRNKKALSINNHLHTLALKYQLAVVPLYEPTKQIHFWLTAYAPDLFHPNDVGYTFWTTAFWDTLQKTRQK